MCVCVFFLPYIILLQSTGITITHTFINILHFHQYVCVCFHTPSFHIASSSVVTEESSAVDALSNK